MEASYEYGGAPAVEATSRRSKVIAASLAGLLLGLVAGVLLVAVRDYVRRRPQAESD
jgi:hypothetical protein